MSATQMATEADSFELLGVVRGADLKTIRAAYRKAALEHHPDNCPGDRAEAQRRFHRITEAYHAAVQYYYWNVARARSRPADALSPQDFLRAGHARNAAAPTCAAASPHARWQGAQVVRKTTLAAVDETRAFVLMWIASIALSSTAICVIAPRLLEGWRGWAGPAGLAAAAGAALGVYAALLAVSLGLLVLTRKVVSTVVRLGFFGLLSLPRSHRPRELPGRR